MINVLLERAYIYMVAAALVVQRRMINGVYVIGRTRYIINIIYIYIYKYVSRIVTEQSKNIKKRTPRRRKKAPEDISKVLLEKFNFRVINQLGFEIPHCRRWYIGPGHVSPALYPSSWFQFGFFPRIYLWLLWPALLLPRPRCFPDFLCPLSPQRPMTFIRLSVSGALKACQREIIITFPPKIPPTVPSGTHTKKKKKKRKNK